MSQAPFVRPRIPSGYHLNGKQSAFADLLNAQEIYPHWHKLLPVTIDLFPTYAVTHSEADFADFHRDLCALLRGRNIRLDNYQAPLEVLCFNAEYRQYQHDFIWQNDFIALWLTVKLPTEPSDPDAVVLNYYTLPTDSEEPAQVNDAPAVTIEVKGGVVVQVESNIPGLSVTIHDRDIGEVADDENWSFHFNDGEEDGDSLEESTGREQLFTEREGNEDRSVSGGTDGE